MGEGNIFSFYRICFLGALFLYAYRLKDSPWLPILEFTAPAAVERDGERRRNRLPRRWSASLTQHVQHFDFSKRRETERKEGGKRKDCRVTEVNFDRSNIAVSSATDSRTQYPAARHVTPPKHVFSFGSLSCLCTPFISLSLSLFKTSFFLRVSKI